MHLTIAVPAWARSWLSDHTDMHRRERPVDPATTPVLEVDLPDDAYYEYAFRDADGRVRADPARPERAENSWYDAVTAVRGPAYAPHPLAAPDAEPTGTLRRLRVDAGAAAPRRVALYEPADLVGPAPLVVAHDGTAYLRVARLPAVLDALIAAGRVPPVRVAFLDPRTPAVRTEEYGYADAYQEALAQFVLPALRREAEATTLYALGASLGGLAWFEAAWRDPAAFAGLALQSPAFLGTPRDRRFHGLEASWPLEVLTRRDGPLPWRVSQEVGTFDWLHDVNARAADACAARAAAHRFAVRSAGHNWTFWRDGLPDALTFLLAP
jgi:enterochelin esterase family protein